METAVRKKNPRENKSPLRVSGKYIAQPVFQFQDNVSLGFTGDEVVSLRQEIKGAIATLGRSVYHEILEPSLTRCSTKEEYLNFIRSHWHEYMEGLNAIHTLMACVSSEEKARVIAEKSFERMMQEIRKGAAKTLGTTAAHEVDFALQTYERAMSLVGRFGSMGEPSDLEKDHTFCFDYRVASAMHILALTSLFAIRSGVRVRSPEILSQIFEFLRQGALDSYASARQAFELRRPALTTPVDELPLDDDDHALAEAHLSDLADNLSLNE